jgi:hypothetical protein
MAGCRPARKWGGGQSADIRGGGKLAWAGQTSGVFETPAVFFVLELVSAQEACFPAAFYPSSGYRPYCRRAASMAR